MTTDASTLDLLERAVTQLDAVIARVRPDEEALPTPCGDWDVKALLTHLVGHSVPNLIVAAGGGAPDWQAEPRAVSADWSGAYRTEADELLAAWRAADMDSMVTSGGGQAPLRSRADQQLAELAVHTWDLAKATGQDTPLDPAVAEHTLSWSHQVLKPEYRGAGRAFGPEVPVASDAPSYDRLAGWFGRNPAWPADGDEPN